MAAPAVNNIQSTSSSLTLSYTVPTVTDGRLVVMVGIEDVGNNNPITGVTFGAAALTQDADAVSVLGSNSNRMAIYSLALPTAGTDTITISASNERIGIIAFTLSDCGAKTDSDTDVITSSGSTMTTNVTTVGADNIVVSCTNNSTTTATTNPAGTTAIRNLNSSSTVRFQSFYEDAASAGLVSSTASGFDIRSAMATVSYAPSAGGGGLTVQPTGIASEESFGSPSVQNQLQILGTTGIASEESFGTPSVANQSQVVSAVSIATSEVFGTPELVQAVVLVPSGISTSELFGDPEVISVLQQVFVDAIASGEAFGAVFVSGGDSIVIPVVDRQTYDKISTYLKTLGFTGQCNDIIYAWLVSEGLQGQYNDLWYDYLQQLGLQGTESDMFAAWKKGGGVIPWILEQGSWNDAGVWRDSSVWNDS